MPQATPGQTETFKVQRDDGQVVEVTGRVLAREVKPEPEQPAASAEPQSSP